MVREECPAIRASVKASHPDSASRVSAVCRNVYGGNGFTSDYTPSSLAAFFTDSLFSDGSISARLAEIHANAAAQEMPTQPRREPSTPRSHLQLPPFKAFKACSHPTESDHRCANRQPLWLFGKQTRAQHGSEI